MSNGNYLTVASSCTAFCISLSVQPFVLIASLHCFTTSCLSGIYSASFSKLLLPALVMMTILQGLSRRME